ncbi:IS3 family transposase [Nonomuraea sp. B12E4]|uniref:IS3 family transposase n=1 Tax=Nonomuraea sp. B12E4 TaxID=3153564 RepID=UPI00325DAEB6
MAGKNYSEEFKDEVVKAVLDEQSTIGQAAKDFGVSRETVRNWVTKEKRRRSGNTEPARDAAERARVREMERRIAELEQENAFLKKCAGLLCEGAVAGEKFSLIHAEEANFSLPMMCRLLGVSRSGYYEWRDRPMSAGKRRREDLKPLIEEVFAESGRTYGYRRVHAALARMGIEVDDELVRALMRDLGLTPVQVKRRRGLTVADKAAGLIPDLVGRDFTAEEPGAKLVGDITEIRTGEGPLYLATVIDCFSKAVIGWALDVRYPAGLVCAALDMAAMRVDIPVGAIFHSDRGSQYTSHEYAVRLMRHGLRQSVGRTGICFDNSMAESFFGKLKTEFVHHRNFTSVAEARTAVIKYIEGFYNRRRLHSVLGYRPPLEVLEEWFDRQVAA